MRAPSKMFEKDGTYKVQVTATDDANCRVTKTVEVEVGTVNCMVKADFSFYVDPQTKAVIMKSESSSNADKLVWNFGDGTQEIGAGTTHFFKEAKTYLVTLTAWDTQNQCADKVEYFVKVGDNICQANFEAKIDPATKSVEFINYSSGTESYQWKFGDNQFSDLENPMHEYKTAGLYFVELLALNKTNGCQHHIKLPVQIGDPQCKAYFNAEANGKTVQFTNNSKGKTSDTRYLWIFGDGKQVFDQEMPTHEYPRGGKFDVTLIMGNPSTKCYDEYHSTVELEIENDFIRPDFVYKANFETREVLFFNNSVTNKDGVSYEWNFNDATENSFDVNPVHTFGTGKNLFKVCLSAMYDTNGDNEPDRRFTQCQPVQVGSTCMADFSYSIDPTDHTKINFINTSISEGATEYAWKLAKEGVSTEKDPFWDFQTEKAYWVTLAIQSATCSDVIVKMINLKPEGGLACGFDFKVGQPTKKRKARPTDFYGATSGGSTAKWNFGNGTKKSGNLDSSTLNPTVIYEQGGTYTVTFTLTDPITGEQSEYTNQVFINDEPIAAVGDNQIVVAGDKVTLDGSASSDATLTGTFVYKWTAPQGVTLDNASAAKPTFTAPDVNSDTQYIFTLVVNDGEFDSEPVQVTVTVSKKVTPVELVEPASLHAYPSPAVDFAQIEYTLTRSTHAKLVVFDPTGRQIETLVDAQQAVGKYDVRLKTGSLKSGLYWVRLITDTETISQQVVVK
jgi:PKD repeat protein